jgi:LmbE family N-acetylglucosaminyl deacetylase
MALACLFGKPFQLPDGPLVVVAPHPDDEVFGAGGLLAMATAKGLPVHVMFLTNGGGSHRGCCNLDEMDVGYKRCELSVEAAKFLGYPASTIHSFRQKDGALPHPGDPGFDKLVTEMADNMRNISPATILAPHPLEGWSDHIAAESLTRAAIAKLDRPIRLIHYCVWFWLSMPFHKTWWIKWSRASVLNIADVYDRREKAVNIYLNANAPCGNPWIGALPVLLLKILESKKELYFDASSNR